MLTKRAVLATAIAAGLTSSLGDIASAQTKQVTVRIGFNPFAGTAGINGIIQEQKLYEKYAKKYGYSIVTDWKEFIAGGPPANAAMMSGNLDIDMDISSAAMAARMSSTRVPASTSFALALASAARVDACAISSRRTPFTSSSSAWDIASRWATAPRRFASAVSTSA